MADKRRVSLRIPEKILAGVYANRMTVRHTREEFLIEFVNRFPPRGVVTARIIVSPGHLKRMVGALRQAVRRYEGVNGPIMIHSSTTPAKPEPSPETPLKREDPRPAMPEHVLAGVYANQMMITHTRQEFLLDFVNVFPPESVVTSRVLTSPEHAKRMIAALRDNLLRYESTHGPVVEAARPEPDPSLLN